MPSPMGSPSNPPTNGTGAGTATSTTPATSPPSVINGAHTEAVEMLEPYCPQPPRTGTSSFFSNALRRLSSGSQGAVGAKVIPHGAVCPRRVMNLDPNRERCLVPELDGAKLRRVAFCVDVEIAAGPRYKDDADCSERRKKKNKDKKLKERGEGEALKHPDKVVCEKEKDGQIHVTGEEVGVSADPEPEDATTPTEGKKEPSTKKKEKKKRSEAERKERKEKKRRKAEENGQIPMELSRESDEGSAVPTPSGASTPKPQDRPTIDPLRIYRRCCQLRETPILKRINDQLLQSASNGISEPGSVNCLDLTGSRLQLADLMTLADWLAIVPVKKLLMEDADLTDEGIRVVLSGLLAAKSPEVSRRRFHTPIRGTDPEYHPPVYEERAGVVEKLTIKNNPKIGREGWRHIALFIHMCKSVRALDVSMIPLPPPLAKNNQSNDKRLEACNTAGILAKAISERLGGSRLEELIMAECSLTTQDIRKIIDGVTVSGLKRLGLAGNNIDDEGLDHVIRYVKSDVCEGLDLGGNDLRSRVDRLCDALSDKCPLWALSLAACNLTPDSLRPLFPALIRLPSFRFLDLSHNTELFSSEPSALCHLRKYLPELKALKRLHLTDVSMSPAQAIGLAEIFPEIATLAHINLLENPQLSALAHATNEASQEEACALYASLMAAVRVSDTIIAIDIDVPGPETSEVVQALAKQVVAYCLRNMDKWATADAVQNGGAIAPGESTSEKQVQVPDVLLHLVGHVEGFSENHDDDDPAPDDDYIVGGTGVVKALSYCLLERAQEIRNRSTPVSGTTTPTRRHANEESSAKAKHMSKNLLDSARKIRMRLRPAMAREASAADETAYRTSNEFNMEVCQPMLTLSRITGRLVFLDQTLQGIIKRFEDEYPETRVEGTPNGAAGNATVPDDASVLSSSPSSLTEQGTSLHTDTTLADQDSDSDTAEPRIARHSRTTSEVSLASRALALEEGRIHRLGQRMRQDLIRAPSPVPHRSPAHSRPTSSQGDDDAKLKEQLRVLEERFQRFREANGAEILAEFNRAGWDEICRRMGQNSEELRVLETEHPQEFEKFRQSQFAAMANRGERNDEQAIEDGEE